MTSFIMTPEVTEVYKIQTAFLRQTIYTLLDNIERDFRNILIQTVEYIQLDGKTERNTF